MNKEEEILRIAREKYPPGTIFKSAYDSNRYLNCKVKNERFYFEGLNLFTHNDDAIYYHEENKLKQRYTWAEIISTPIKSYELW